MTLTGDDLLSGYRTDLGIYDEAVAADGSPRAGARAELDALAGRDLARLAADVAAHAEREGVVFHSVDGDQAFVIDPVPRVLTHTEWAALESGLIQRVAALNAFVADVYGDARIVREGVVPPHVVETAEYHEPRMRGVHPPGGLWIGVAGLDLVRDHSGRFLVLEDNLRTPSGYAYAAAARAALATHLEVGAANAPRPLDDVPAMLEWALQSATPGGGGGRLVYLTDGADNPAYYEHDWAARAMRVPLVLPGDLESRDDRLWLDGQPVDGVYRRTNADRLDTPVGELLLGPLRAGTLGVVNAFGTGVADDKLSHAYVEDMIRFYLDEEPLLASVETFDLGRPEILERALDVLDQLVVKPRGGHGGVGVVICPHAEREDVERLRAAVLESPADWIAQRMVMLSTHPTVIDGRLAPRHVDLRPYVFLGRDGEARVMPGGLSRVAFDEGALVVNSSQNGGAKDTWVLR